MLGCGGEVRSQFGIALAKNPVTDFSLKHPLLGAWPRHKWEFSSLGCLGTVAQPLECGWERPPVPGARTEDCSPLLPGVELQLCRQCPWPAPQGPLGATCRPS